MLCLRDIMTADVVTVSPAMTLRDAIEILHEAGVSGAPVVAGEKVVGVVSAADFLDFEASTPGVPTDRPNQVDWGEWETPDTWEEGADQPAWYFVDLWSDVGADVLERFSEAEGPEWDILEEHTVAEVMTLALRSLPPEAPVVEAARLMTQHRMHRLLVMEDAELVGIVSTADIVRAVAEDRF